MVRACLFLGLFSIFALAPIARAANDAGIDPATQGGVPSLGSGVYLSGGSAFLFGAFCALWAQNTGRGSWTWFFLGLFFNVITVIVLLSKNANDLRRTREAWQVNHPPA